MARGGSKGFGSGGVGGARAPGMEQISTFLTRTKNSGQVDQGPWLQERVGGA